MKVTHDDRKHASQFMTLIMRQAYGGNMLVAEHALAKLLADERERCAKKLEDWDCILGTEIGISLQEAARRLRGETTGLDDDSGRGETGETDVERESSHVGKPDESHNDCVV